MAFAGRCDKCANQCSVYRGTARASLSSTTAVLTYDSSASPLGCPCASSKDQKAAPPPKAKTEEQIKAEKLKAAAAAMKAAPVSKLPADDSMWDDF